MARSPQIIAGAGLLGVPAAEGGLGDEQAMRVLMLLARTGRRVSEICLLDRAPLLPLGQAASGRDSAGFTARLRYQQTKIEGAPDTILVDEEIVAIIRTQQQWADRFLAASQSAATAPKYLFLAARNNRNGDRPYSPSRLRALLAQLAARLGVRDSTGAIVDFNRTHRFRHTKATSLLNAGVPLHVVQRYLGHLSPEMTMIYAKTLASTHEAEFLRYRKLTADARELGTDPRDLYDMLQLDKRTDRILPNGWCLLPPRQSCSKGNACLTCDKFATDATFLPELTAQQARTQQLIGERREAFRTRTGQELGDDNVLARRAPPGTRRPRPDHRQARAGPARGRHHPGAARGRCLRPHRCHHRKPARQPSRCAVTPATCAGPPPPRAQPPRPAPRTGSSRCSAAVTQSPSAASPRPPASRWTSSTAPARSAAGSSSSGPGREPRPRPPHQHPARTSRAV